jgi:PAS domain S-box-containing protein
MEERVDFLELVGKIDCKRIRRGITNGEFAPNFQPIVNLPTGQLVGFEVLARWKHPDLGNILPTEFIPIAERESCIYSLTEDMLLRAFTFALPISSKLNFAINISPLQLHDGRLPRQIREASNQTGFVLNRLTIEITETTWIENLADAFAIAVELKSMGCKIALDDFGTGYSSLLHLQALPFDALKIDRSFIRSMTTQRESRTIVAAVVGLGESLGLTTIAEGIETEQQAEMMHWLGCELGQGWLYGRPVAGEYLERTVERHRPPSFLDTAHPWKNISKENLDGLRAQRLAQLTALSARDSGEPVSVNQVAPALSGQVSSAGNNAIAVDEEILALIAAASAKQRERAIRALRDSVEHYRKLVSLSPQVLWVMDKGGNVLDIFPGWDQPDNSSSWDFCGRGWTDVMHPDDLQETLDIIADSGKTGARIHVEYRVRLQDGEWHWIRARGSPSFDDSGNFVCWYGSAEDITELMETRRQLLEAEAKIEGLMAERAGLPDVSDRAKSPTSPS